MSRVSGSDPIRAIAHKRPEADNQPHIRSGGSMKLSRTTVLVAFFVFALAAPVAALAIETSSSDHGADHGASHPQKAGHDRHEKSGHEKSGQERADEASAAGRAHAEAMKEWARCVAEAAAGPKADGDTTPPKEACGDKPIGPGRAKNGSGGPGAPSLTPGHGKDHSRGRSGAHAPH
jgi:hypothetical protein